MFDEVELLGLFHARKLKLHAVALKLGWDAVHPRLKLTKPFYDRFTPAIATSDFALRPTKLDGALPTARRTVLVAHRLIPRETS